MTKQQSQARKGKELNLIVEVTYMHATKPVQTGQPQLHGLVNKPWPWYRYKYMFNSYMMHVTFLIGRIEVLELVHGRRRCGTDGDYLGAVCPNSKGCFERRWMEWARETTSSSKQMNGATCPVFAET